MPSFPTTRILDNANRANENPLSQSGAWTTVSGLSALQVVSNAIKATANFAGSYRGSFRDAEVYATISTVAAGTSVFLSTRYQDAGGASPIRDSRRRGYQLSASNTTYKLTRMDDGATGSDIIAATSWPGGNLANGDAVGLRSYGTTHEVWLKRSAGSWTLVATAFDSTYTNSGALLCQIESTSAVVDNFGGGQANLVVPPPRPRMRTKPILFKLMRGQMDFFIPPPPVSNIVAVAGLSSAASFGSVSTSLSAVPAVPGMSTPLLIRLSPFRVTAPADFPAAAAFAQTVSVGGLGSAAAFGTIKVNQAFTVVGLSSAASFGTVQVNQAFAVTGLGSAAAFGAVQVNQRVPVATLGSAAAFGSIQVNQTFTVAGLGSAAAFGAISSSTTQPLLSVPIPLLIRLSPFRVTQPAVLTLYGSQAVSITGLGSAAAFGTFQVNQALTVTGLGSAASFGSVRVNQRFVVSGLGSAASFGAVTAVPGNINISVTGLGSAGVFGDVFIPGGVVGTSTARKIFISRFGIY